MRRPLFAGNWKMHHTILETKVYFERFLHLLLKRDLSDRTIAIAPPFTSLSYAHSLLKETPVKLIAQNAHYATKGAFTGEISPLMLKELGVDYVILGHSERRHLFGEGDELIQKRVEGVYKFGLIPILCVGETEDERKRGQTFERIEVQLRLGLSGLKDPASERLVIAYEPVWAIGTGVNATPAQAEEVHLFIRRLLRELYGEEKAERILILYGGSVTPENVNELMGQPNIDGVLVGGASLDPEKFFKICATEVKTF